jgi:hypothetical protein
VIRRSSKNKARKLTKDYAVALASVSCRREASGVFRMSVPSLTPLDKNLFESRSAQISFTFFPVLASSCVAFGFHSQLSADTLLVSGDASALSALQRLIPASSSSASEPIVGGLSDTPAALSPSISANLRKANELASKRAAKQH